MLAILEQFWPHKQSRIAITFDVEYTPHHAEGLVDTNMRYTKTVTGLRDPRACRIRKLKIEN
jgi:hypothetical protein